MVESLTPWVVPVHDTRGSETTSLQHLYVNSKECKSTKLLQKYQRLRRRFPAFFTNHTLQIPRDFAHNREIVFFFVGKIDETACTLLRRLS